MKKTLFAALALGVPMLLSAQSAVDAYTLSQTELRGTARFMSMGGAFTALGGDLSTLSQNPAGIGVYRRSEIGATLDISPRSIKAATSTNDFKTNKTKVNCNNFGYVGTARLDGALRTFNWGVTYNRVASFDRVFHAYNGGPTHSSLSNYIASFTGNTPEADLNFGYSDASSTPSYNPYLDGTADWLSILAYNSYMINPDGQGGYQGLSNNSTNGDADSQVHEKGYVDEYAIDFGGNVNNVVMWGIGFGITDLNFHRTTYYSESMENATVPYDNGSGSSAGQLVNGNAGFQLDNYQSINGTGFNLKLGVILRPINELRIGFAVHTPTWYSLSQSSYATTGFSYLNPNAPETDHNPLQGNEETDNSYYNFHMTSPWKLMFGAAAVIGNQAIVSLDYERQAYGNTKVSYQDQYGNYVSDDNVNDDTKNYFKAANILRAGIEYRVTPQLSLRAGYNYTSATSKDEVLDGKTEVYTAGMNPAYTLNRTTNAISLGLGYRFSQFYIDAAYVYRNRKSTYFAYTPYNGIQTPKADLTENTNSIVLSVGVKF